MYNTYMMLSASHMVFQMPLAASLHLPSSCQGVSLSLSIYIYIYTSQHLSLSIYIYIIYPYIYIYIYMYYSLSALPRASYFVARPPDLY